MSNKVETIKKSAKCGCPCNTNGEMDLEALYWRGVSKEDREKECECDKWEERKEEE